MSTVKKENCVSIVKNGYLFIKRPPKNGFIRLKSWHKRYFVLRDETIDHPSRLEMYQKEADFFKNQARFVLNLDRVIHVGRAEDSKRFRQAFMVVCAGRSPILLAEEDAMYMNSWLLAVTLIAEKRSDHVDGSDGCLSYHCSCRLQLARPECRRSLSGECNDCFDSFPCFNDSQFDESFVKRYEVSVDSTLTSRRNCIEGDYILTIRPWGLSLSKPRSEDYVVNWPLCFIRKFKSESLPQSYYKKRSYLVTLELGRRCATGEGILQFHTLHGKEIIADMNQAICRSMSTKLLPDDIGKQRSKSRSRPSIQGSYCNSGWRSSSKGSSSSLNIKMSVSRQSSGGTTSSSRLMLDGSYHGTESNLYQNGSDFPHIRSPLRSDSSGDSKYVEGSVPRLRTSISSITSVSSSSSSSPSSTSVTSRKNHSSGESAQYVEAGFPELDSSRRSSCIKPKRSGSLGQHPPSTVGAETSSQIQESQKSDETVESEDVKKLSDDRMAKAAAEGYLEVLPDMFHNSKESEKATQEELNNIYHIVDFSKSNNSPSLLTPAVQYRHHSTSSLGVNGRSDVELKRLRSPRSSFTDCSDPEVFTSEINGCGSIAATRKSSGSRIMNSLGKPPAPLPRPEHTITSK